MDNFVKAIAAGNWILATALVLIALGINFPRILEFIIKWEHRRQEYIQNALQIGSISQSVRSFLEDELDYLVFKRVTGISANRRMRDKIKEIIDKSNGSIKTSQLARAKGYIKMDANKLSVDISFIDKFEVVSNWIFAIIIVFYLVSIFKALSHIQQFSLEQILALVTVGALLSFFALFLVLPTFPLIAAKKIKPIIDNLEAIE